MLTDSELLEVYKAILDASYEGIVVVDSKGVIEYMNESFARLLGVTPEEAVGRHATEVIENTRMHLILKTGRAEIGELQEIGGKKVVVTRIPIKKNGKLVRAVGKVLFQDLKELEDIKRKVDRLSGELEYYKRELYKVRNIRYDFEKIKGRSKAITAAKDLALKAAKSSAPVPVLLTGEKGTGKDMFAQAIHSAGNRQMGPFVKINCRVEMDFLHVIDRDYKQGYNKLEMARGGTLYLDEISALPGSLQQRLLEVVSDPDYDIRYISSTSTDILAELNKGRFDSELYYRLSVFTITIPPLRDRVEDIPLISDDIIDRLSSSMGLYVRGISDQAMKKLMTHHWPGNVRELQNVLERAVNLMDERRIIRAADIEFKDISRLEGTTRLGERDLKSSLNDVERQAIIDALERAGGNKSEAARILKISRSSFYHKLREYGIIE